MNIENRLTLKQLACLREVRRQGLNMSAAAAALHSSQPGVTRQIQEMEQALGVQLLIRRRNRVLAFSDAGNAILQAADRILAEVENIGAIAEDRRDAGAGLLTVATSHLHARYTLRSPVKTFIKRFPRVQLRLMQADADAVQDLVESRLADIGISSDIARPNPLLATLEGGEIRRSIILPKGHPLAALRKPTLKDLAKYPIVGYNARSRGGAIMDRAFGEKGLNPTYAVRAADSDVIVTYVEDGLGLAVVPSTAVAATNTRLHAKDASHLFPPSVTIVSARRNSHLRAYTVELIRLVAPGLSPADIRGAVG